MRSGWNERTLLDIYKKFYSDEINNIDTVDVIFFKEIKVLFMYEKNWLKCFCVLDYLKI